MKSNKGENHFLNTGKTFSCPKCGYKWDFHTFCDNVNFYGNTTNITGITCPVCKERWDKTDLDVIE